MSEFSLEAELNKALKRKEEEEKTSNVVDTNQEENEENYDEDDDYDYEEYEEDGECEEEVVEISENELLAMLDAQKDPFEVCKQIFNEEKLFDSSLDDNTVLIEPNLTIQHLRALHTKGFVVVDNFVPLEDASTIYQLAKKLSHTFKPACELKKSYEDSCEDEFRDNTARSDLIKWLHPKDFTCREDGRLENLSEDDAAWKKNQTLVNIVLNKFKVIQKILHDYSQCIKYSDETMELMWSLYRETGTYYEKHRDSFPSNGKDEGPLDQRKVTALLYLNTEWKGEEDGGQLNIFVKPEQCTKHTERTTIKIDPIACRLVLFLSGALDHEVLKSYKDRVALTSWFS